MKMNYQKIKLNIKIMKLIIKMNKKKKIKKK